MSFLASGVLRYFIINIIFYVYFTLSLSPDHHFPYAHNAYSMDKFNLIHRVYQFRFAYFRFMLINPRFMVSTWIEVKNESNVWSNKRNSSAFDNFTEKEQKKKFFLIGNDGLWAMMFHVCWQPWAPHLEVGFSGWIGALQKAKGDTVRYEREGGLKFIATSSWSLNTSPLIFTISCILRALGR